MIQTSVESLSLKAPQGIQDGEPVSIGCIFFVSLRVSIHDIIGIGL
jgi:hypothetical protein